MGENQYDEAVAAATAFIVCAAERALLQKRFGLALGYVPHHTWGMKPPEGPVTGSDLSGAWSAFVCHRGGTWGFASSKKNLFCLPTQLIN